MCGLFQELFGVQDVDMVCGLFQELFGVQGVDMVCDLFQELFGIQGVDMVVRYLRTDTKLLNSGLGHHKLLLAAIDCTWYVRPAFSTTFMCCSRIVDYSLTSGPIWGY